MLDAEAVFAGGGGRDGEKVWSGVPRGWVGPGLGGVRGDVRGEGEGVYRCWVREVFCVRGLRLQSPPRGRTTASHHLSASLQIVPHMPSHISHLSPHKTK